MHLSNNGQGEVLIFPFYSALEGDRTLITISNSTGYVKGVTVKVREGMNGSVGLGWHLYLGPYDSFSFTIAQDFDGEGAVTGPVASEQTCTVPSFAYYPDGVSLQNYDWSDEGFSGVERSLSGYVEVIEMGQWDPFVGTKGPAAARGASGAEADCATLVYAWSQIGGINGDWLSNPTDEALLWRGGGLYGSATIRSSSASVSYEALSLAEFARYELPAEYHEYPGSDGLNWPFASLNSASRSYEQHLGGTKVRQTAPEGRDAVSALLSKTVIQSTAPAQENSIQSWVASYPTKHLHTRNDSWLGAFSQPWDSVLSKSCDYIELGKYKPTENSFETFGHTQFCGAVNLVNTSSAGEAPFSFPYWSTSPFVSSVQALPNAMRSGYRSETSEATSWTYDRTVTVDTKYDSDTQIAGLPMVVIPVYFGMLGDIAIGSVQSETTRIYARISTSLKSAQAGESASTVTLETTNTSGFEVAEHVVQCRGSRGYFQSRSESEVVQVSALAKGEKYTCVAFASTDTGRGEATAEFSLQVGAEPSPPEVIGVDYDDRSISLSVIAENNGSEITSFEATCTDGITSYIATSPSSPVTVDGLVNGVAYTCTVTATNSVGTSSASSATDPITPEETTSSLPIWLLQQIAQ